MKNLRKVLLIFAVVLCMAICFFAVEASAGSITLDDGSTLNYSISNGQATITSSPDASGDVVIPDTVTEDGVTYPVTGLGYEALRYSDLTSVTIGKNVTDIGEAAFRNCSSLTSIIIPDNVTTLGECAFYDDEALTSVTIGNGVTSIGDMAFAYCKALTSINIPDSVTSIGSSAFEECKALTSINIPDSVTSIGVAAFVQCEALKDITIPDSVTSIGDYTFMQCLSLASITIPDSVTSIGYGAFALTAITDITIPDSVTSIGTLAFYGCPSLASVTIGDGVTNIDIGAFAECPALTTVTCSCAKDVAAVTILDFEDYPNPEIITDTTKWTKVHTPAAAVKENEVAATCTKEGSYDSVVYCSVCNAEISRTPMTLDIDSTAHVDADNNNICDRCGTNLAPASEDTGCHWCAMVKNSSGAMKTFYTVIDIIYHYFERILSLFDYIR